MTGSPDEFDIFHVSSSEARLIDTLCDEFESAFRAREAFSLSESLARISEPARPLALECLLVLERDLSRELGLVSRSVNQLRLELEEYLHLLDEVWPRVRAAEAHDSADASSMADLPDFWPDRFRFIRQLGTGGMGAVYLAEHRLLGKQVAVKIPHNFGAGNSETLQRFRREIRTLAQLQHPGLAAALDADFIAGRMFLVMEFVDGRSLHEIVSEQGVLRWHEAVSKISQVAETLAFAHSKDVVHRDVTPRNLMVDSTGRVRVLDLGLARLIEEATRSGDHIFNFSGTPGFAAPEQQEGALPDPRADIYGLGCSLYFLLCGKPMYTAGSLSDLLIHHRESEIPSLTGVDRQIPLRLEILFRRMVAKSPSDRPSSMYEVLEDLQRLQVVPSPNPNQHQLTRRRWLLGGSVTVGVMAGAIMLARQNRSTAGMFTNSIGLPFANWALISRSTDKAALSPPHADAPAGFWGTSLISASQYDHVMGQPSRTVAEMHAGLTWPEANEFCHRLSALPAELAARRRYRLPRESDWSELGALQQDLENGLRVAHRSSSGRSSIRVWLAELNSLGIWSWCEDHLHARVGPRSIGNIPDSERIGQFPLRGGSGLFIHNFDLFMRPTESLVQQDRVELSTENDGRTRYFMPLIAGEPGLLVYRYRLEQPIRSAAIFGKILAHKPTSHVSLEVSGAAGPWKLVDEGFVHDSHLSPRDVSSVVQGGQELLVRFKISEESPRRFWAQALRTSPEPHLQFPNVYQVVVDTAPSSGRIESRLVAPGSLRHARIGLRVFCEIV